MSRLNKTQEPKSKYVTNDELADSVILTVDKEDKLVKIQRKNEYHQISTLVELRYNRYNELVYYLDYQGNWYDARFFQSECPFDPMALIKKRGIFPASVRMVPMLIAQELVAVQPMEPPRGNLFYLDTIYDNPLNSRYADKKVNKKFYSRIKITNDKFSFSSIIRKIIKFFKNLI